MSTYEVHESHRKVAIILQNKLKGVKQNQRKLRNLEEGKESSPPSKILFHSGKGSNKHEIAVNDDVDESVKISEERRVTSR